MTWRWRGGRVESVHNYTGVLIPLHEAHLEAHSSQRSHPSESAEAQASCDNEDEVKGMLDSEAAEYTLDSLRKEVRQGGRGQYTEYELKSRLINKAIQDIGMGSHNWTLFVLCGFGWFADNLWLQGVSLCLPSLSAEFDVSEKTVRYTTSALFIGLSAGSFVWGIGSDVFGRRIAFNLTLLIAAVFGIAAAHAPSWPAVCALLAALGFGVGGSLPVDGALFLEFLPDANASLLTLLSVWWPLGQLAASLAAWYCITAWPVEQGWRNFLIAIGIVTFAMFCLRFFAFRLFESPKFLLVKGRQQEAVAVVHGIAHANKTRTWLTSELLDQVADDFAQAPVDDFAQVDVDDSAHQALSSLSSPRFGVLTGKLKGLSGHRLGLLFQSKTLGLATALVWFCWASIGMGYPLFNAFLPQYFSHSHSHSEVQSETAPISDETYRNYAITSTMGVPGSLVAAYLVEHPSPLLGRRGTLAGSTLVSAIFLFLFVSLGSDAGWQLAFSCVEAFAQNIMYGVLYAFTPEIFPAPVRGAGTGMASFLNRLAGLMAPVLAANIPGDGATIPIYTSAVMILLAFVAMCLIPVETRGAQRL